MDARETWQALHARLTAARAAIDAGDRKRAFAEITAALDIDPDFLAAHSLRDCVLAPAAEPNVWRDPAASPAAQEESPGFVAAERPLASADGYAKFEQRAKRRRVDRRLDAARAALNAGCLDAAATSLDEVIELDPNLPDLAALTAEFDDLRRSRAPARRGPRLVAVAAFVIMLLGARLLQESTSLISHPMIASPPLVAAPMPAVTVPSEATAVGWYILDAVIGVVAVVTSVEVPPAVLRKSGCPNTSKACPPHTGQRPE